ncbi:LuxR family transcriptional regulator [Hephaestia sp. GCM10023244]|uniref:helix-turn-helix transcriptional regulator n=1 Tax=unclassified Hephaestia TaxID=2631281 RepID=UPI002076D746|nr:LuxR family transcriptional regulator [Hephaestia sp. MAHUQ-44]MCM8732424.1 LuxR family transcriptional regulator [Hephaestia sp. MAHUQ-44]
MYKLVADVVPRIIAADTLGDLTDTLGAVATQLGFAHFALSHHVDLARAGGRAIRLHNYPERWAAYYETNALGVTDPVHRASHVTSIGFRWSRIPELIPLTARDRQMLARGRDEGIGDGFTVPAHVPGEARGSCSFANPADREMTREHLPVAQLVGAFAFERARRLAAVRPFAVTPRAVLTDRQRDCVLWVARGKGDWETSRILGVSEETVACHIKHACERYDVNKRTLLMIRTLFDGTLTFGDIVQR